MNKTWNYNGVDYTMTKTGYGQYNLNGYHCTDSTIWDWCDDDESEDKMMEAWKAAERFFNSQDRKSGEWMTLNDVRDYINSEDFDAIELEHILEEGEWFAGSSDDNFGTDGYDKIVMQDNGKVAVVAITPENIDKSDIQAYVRRETRRGNSVCIDDEGNGSAGFAWIDYGTGEQFIECLNDFSEPIEVTGNNIPESFSQEIDMEDMYVFKLTKGDYAIFIALHFN